MGKNESEMNLIWELIDIINQFSSNEEDLLVAFLPFLLLLLLGVVGRGGEWPH